MPAVAGRTGRAAGSTRPRSHRQTPTTPGLPGYVGVGSVVSRVYLTVVGGLLFWSLLPVLFGLSPVVVRTGSMQPAVQPGDVLLVQHLPAAAVRPGQVVLATNPADPSRLLSHRVVQVNDDGTLVTRGDANATNDSTPVAPAEVKGVARLRVPFIGRAAVWWWEGQRGRTLVWLALSGVAVLLAGARAAGFDAHSSPEVAPAVTIRRRADQPSAWWPTAAPAGRHRRPSRTRVARWVPVWQAGVG